MILQELHISRNSWEPATSPLKGKIVFRGDSGAVELPLDAEVSAKLLAVVADAIVASSKRLAADLTSDVINQVPQLEAPAPVPPPPPAAPDDDICF